MIGTFLATKQTTRNISNIIIVSMGIFDLLSCIAGMPPFAPLSTASRFSIITIIVVAFYITLEHSTLVLAVDGYILMNPHLNIQLHLRRKSKLDQDPSDNFLNKKLIFNSIYPKSGLVLEIFQR